MILSSRLLIEANRVTQPWKILRYAIIQAKSRYRRPFMIKSGLENVMINKIRASKYRLPGLRSRAKTYSRFPRKISI